MIKYAKAITPSCTDCDKPIKNITVLLIKFPIIGKSPHKNVTTTITKEYGSGDPARIKAPRKSPVKKVLIAEMMT